MNSQRLLKRFGIPSAADEARMNDAAATGRRMIDDGFSLADAEAEVRRLAGDAALEVFDAMLGNRRLTAGAHTALTLRGLTVPTYVIR